MFACSEGAAGINLRAGSHARTAPVTAKNQMKTSTTIPRTAPAVLLRAAPRFPRTMRKGLMGAPFLMKLAASLGES
jgi:hypothetical protein